MADGRLIALLCCMINMYGYKFGEAVQCHVCSGPPMICERLHHSEKCTSPDDVCVNYLNNHDTGARELIRRCGTSAECDANATLTDRCTTFDPKFVQTLNFECTFCCDTDNCNVDVVPTPIWTSVG